MGFIHVQDRQGLEQARAQQNAMNSMREEIDELKALVKTLTEDK